MKRMMILLVGMLFIFGVSAAAFAADAAPTTKAPAVTAPAAPAPAVVKKTAHSVKATHMRTYGKVTEMTDTSLKIERKVKGKAEMMEFALEKPAKVKVGEIVTVRYVRKNGQNLALYVTKTRFRHHHKTTKK